MNTKVLCIAVLVLTVLILGANHYAQKVDYATCPECKCSITVGTVVGPKGTVKEPSCSLRIRLKAPVKAIAYMELLTDETQDFSACLFAVFCDTQRQAYVECGGAVMAVNQRQSCYGSCVSNQAKGWMDMQCESWARMKSTTKKKKSGSPASTTPSMLFASTNTSISMISRLLPAKYSEAPPDYEEAKNIITGATRWRLIDGEAGIDRGVFTVATGEAEVQSFCTGDTLRLVGPNVITLPNCQVDVSGHWQGAYATRLTDGKLKTMAVSLDLRKESGTLKGELKTLEGIFNILSARQNGTHLQLEASGSVAGKDRKIVLNGELTKGGIAFAGTESGTGEKPLTLRGAVRRLYIADDALLPAVLNQPYNFKLTAISLDTEAVTFRLADGRLPRGISFDVSSGTFSGTPTEIGNSNIRIVAEDSAGNVFEQPLNITVKQMTIATLMPDAFIGQPYSATLKVTGGRPPYRFSGFPPKGLTLDPNTGVLSGIPTSNRHESSPFTVRDSQNNSESYNVGLQVRRTTILTSHFLPEATQGSLYRTQFQVVGNNLPVQWTNVGAEDAFSSLGLSLNRQTGELSGTPIKHGAFLLSVLANATSADQQYRTFTLTIKPGR